MRERPILMSAPMVRALLDGTKTQTRRVVKPQPPAICRAVYLPFSQENNWQGYGKDDLICWYGECPYGVPGDQLWVRESFAPDPVQNSRLLAYRADMDANQSGEIRWKPSIHMPRWASRILLQITGVSVERLQDISAEEAMAEGMHEFQLPTGSVFGYSRSGTPGPLLGDTPVAAYYALWEQLNGAGSWEANPWVWVVEFDRVAG